MSQKIVQISAIIVSVLFFTTCTPDKKESENPLPETMQALFNFIETEDKNFCDTNKIIGGDCGFGSVYLNEKGEALFTEFCMGQDTTSYSVGTYVSTDSTLVCSFEKEFCYYDCSDCIEQTTITNPNSGKLHSSSQWNLTLQKSINCKNYDYFRPNTSEEDAEIRKEVEEVKKSGGELVYKRGLVFKKASNEDLKEFLQTIHKIKVLSNL
jgi:hypothetical protein